MDKLQVDSTVIIELNGNEDNWLVQWISSVVLYIGNQTYEAHLVQQISSEIQLKGNPAAPGTNSNYEAGTYYVIKANTKLKDRGIVGKGRRWEGMGKIRERGKQGNYDITPLSRHVIPTC